MKGNFRFDDHHYIRYKSAKCVVNGRVCPVCKKRIDFGDGIVILVTSGCFPNRLIHESCAGDDIEKTISLLVDDYLSALEHKHWFL